MEIIWKMVYLKNNIWDGKIKKFNPKDETNSSENQWNVI